MIGQASARKRQVVFAPVPRLDGRWALGIRFDGEPEPSRFVHWLEGGETPSRVCKSNRRDICWSAYCEAEAAEICAYLNDLYAKGELE